MTNLSINTVGGRSSIIFGDTIAQLEARVGDRRSVVVTDRNVAAALGDRFDLRRAIVIAPGEASKTLSTVEMIYRRFAQLELDRAAIVIGVGGGVVTDIAGFAAATYLRGVDLGLIPTSLLAQVDAAVGGKNGVDLGDYKNLVGTIVQPRFVVVDPTLLATLPPTELRSGMVELIKASVIADADLFARLENDPVALLEREAPILEPAIRAAIEIKARIVEADERESGARRLLNFGHTFGHAVERTVGVSHGEAVAVGMDLAARLSVGRRLLSAGEAERIARLLGAIGLPTIADLTAGEGFDPDRSIEALRRDKKRIGDRIDLVLLAGLGRATRCAVPLAELEEVIRDLH